MTKQQAAQPEQPHTHPDQYPNITMMFPTQRCPHLSATAELLRPGLSPVFSCDAYGATHYGQYHEMIRTRDTKSVPTAELAVLHDHHTLTVAISKSCDRQTSPCFGYMLAWLATQLGYKYFQTWETATLLQRRHIMQTSNGLLTVPTKPAAAATSGSELKNNAGPCEDPMNRIWFAGIVPFLCLPVVRVEDFENDDDDTTVVIDDDSDFSDGSENSQRNTTVTNNTNRNNYTHRHYRSPSPSSTSRDNDDFHRRLEQAAANLVHGGMFILPKTATRVKNWSFNTTVDHSMFKHRSDINVLCAHFMHVCGRLQASFNALALHVVTDARLQDAGGLCVTERKLFAHCVQLAYKRLDDVLGAPCTGLRFDAQCLWTKGLNGWLAVQQRNRIAFPYSGTSSGVKMNVRDVVSQCGLNSCFRSLTLERGNEQWLVVTNEKKDPSDDIDGINEEDDLDDNDENLDDIDDGMDDHPRNAGVALVASVKKDKVIKSGIVVLQDVKRFLDYTAEVEVMLHADSLPLRQQIAADLAQAGVISNDNVVLDAAILLRDDEDSLLDAGAFLTSGSRRG